MKLFRASLLIAVLITFLSCSKDDKNTADGTTITASNFTISVVENPQDGQVIGTIEASTNQGSLNFTIAQENPVGALKVGSTNGEVSVLDSSLFNYSNNPIISATIKISNGSTFKNINITINLEPSIENIYEGSVTLKTQEEVNDFGANNYTQITGQLTIGHPEETGSTNIVDLSPLHSIGIVAALTIKNNTLLTTTEGLNLSTISVQLAVVNNPLLVHLKGFASMTYFNNIFIFDNEALSDLSEFSQITKIGYFSLIGCESLPNIDWLQNLTALESGFDISNCDSLISLDGLSNVTSFSGPLENRGIRISNNLLLENLDGLQNLTTSLYNLDIFNNSSLQNIEGLSNINVFQELTITENESLQNLIGLGSITKVNIHIEIKRNNSLTDLVGLENLETSPGIFTIDGNLNLNNLNGLEGLTHIYSLRIVNNTNLTDFCSLQNLLTTDTNTGFYAFENAYNPTKQDIIDGNCSL
ncbi:MAG TPA: hypothetical protein PKW08_10790 [Flavobacteriaceae bacterium]|nr:cadherin repeat domain-containing protein [Flavobacteriaceae bacterium]MCB9214138.1 cadherin repeat domain-containing protein [Alteromonas sp.]HPF11959.1 hypothetical protein [Flavobacteriaceae bacterium]HQU22062.1 hypothetical protein [Flavobacteriaceae bacterium]HQU65409.1 hypothetical protein [Flavobacteriaceae bacterium]